MSSDEQSPSAERRNPLSLERRVSDLENTLIANERLTVGVERLADETNGLNSILTKVDEQQQQLNNIGKVAREAKSESVSANRNAEASAFAAEEVSATAKIERRLFLRRLYTSLAGAVVIALSAVVGGAWVTDAHLQNCLIDGPTSAAEREVCDLTFPGHEHPQVESIQSLLHTQVENMRAGCQRDNARVLTNISQTRKILALASSEQAREALADTIRDFEAILVNCESAYPFPEELTE